MTTLSDIDLIEYIKELTAKKQITETQVQDIIQNLEKLRETIKNLKQTIEKNTLGNIENIKNIEIKIAINSAKKAAENAFENIIEKEDSIEKAIEKEIMKKVEIAKAEEALKVAKNAKLELQEQMINSHIKKQKAVEYFNKIFNNMQNPEVEKIKTLSNTITLYTNNINNIKIMEYFDKISFKINNITTMQLEILFQQKIINLYTENTEKYFDNILINIHHITTQNQLEILFKKEILDLYVSAMKKLDSTTKVKIYLNTILKNMDSIIDIKQLEFLLINNKVIDNINSISINTLLNLNINLKFILYKTNNIYDTSTNKFFDSFLINNKIINNIKNITADTLKTSLINNFIKLFTENPKITKDIGSLEKLIDICKSIDLDDSIINNFIKLFIDNNFIKLFIDNNNNIEKYFGKLADIYQLIDIHNINLDKLNTILTAEQVEILLTKEVFYLIKKYPEYFKILYNKILNFDTISTENLKILITQENTIQLFTKIGTELAFEIIFHPIKNTSNSEEFKQSTFEIFETVIKNIALANDILPDQAIQVFCLLLLDKNCHNHPIHFVDSYDKINANKMDFNPHLINFADSTDSDKSINSVSNSNSNDSIDPDNNNSNNSFMDTIIEYIYPW